MTSESLTLDCRERSMTDFPRAERVEVIRLANSLATGESLAPAVCAAENIASAAAEQAVAALRFSLLYEREQASQQQPEKRERGPEGGASYRLRRCARNLRVSAPFEVTKLYLVH